MINAGSKWRKRKSYILHEKIAMNFLHALNRNMRKVYWKHSSRLYSVCTIIFTLAPNSTRFAKFCTDLATSVSVLAAVGEGESGRNAK